MMGGLAAEGKFAGLLSCPAVGGLVLPTPVREASSRWSHWEERGWEPGGKNRRGIDLTGEPRDRETVQTDGDRTYRCGGTWRLQRETATRVEADVHTWVDRGGTERQMSGQQRNQSVLENGMDSRALYLTCTPTLPASSAP